MQVRADISSRYRGRWGLMAIFCFAFALWFLYDGAITYPNQRTRALKYAEYQERGALDEWEAHAREQGWPISNPGEAKTPQDIGVQYAMAATVAPVGLIFLFLYLRSRGRWMEANETGIQTSWGQQLKFAQMTQLDKRQWRKKGIAKVIYEQDGRKRKLALDDFIYDREATEIILRRVESYLSDEQIVHGLREPPPEEAEGDVAGDGEGDVAGDVEADGAPTDRAQNAPPQEPA